MSVVGLVDASKEGVIEAEVEVEVIVSGSCPSVVEVRGTGS